MNDVDTVGGYSVPVDPMDDLQCEKLPVTAPPTSKPRLT